jgi:hypothetical protein
MAVIAPLAIERGDRRIEELVHPHKREMRHAWIRQRT